MDKLIRRDREKIVKELDDLSISMDRVTAHIKADIILCNTLRKIGYEDISIAYEKISKQYA